MKKTILSIIFSTAVMSASPAPVEVKNLHSVTDTKSGSLLHVVTFDAVNVSGKAIQRVIYTDYQTNGKAVVALDHVYTGEIGKDASIHKTFRVLDGKHLDGDFGVAVVPSKVEFTDGTVWSN